MSGHPILPSEPITLPLLPLRDVVVFPAHGHPAVRGAAEVDQGARGGHGSGPPDHAGGAEGRRQGRAASADDMFEVGCVSSILQMLKLPDGTVKVLVEGVQRATTRSITDTGEHFIGEVVPVPPAAEATPEIEALRRAVTQQFDQYVKLNKKIPPEILTSIAGIDDPGRLADTIAAHLPLKLEAKQAVLDLFVGRQAAGEAARTARARGRHPAGGKAHPRPRQAADGEEPARVLPERAGQGDPEGTRRRRGRRRPRGTREEDQGRQHEQGRRARRPRASSRSSS